VSRFKNVNERTGDSLTGFNPIHAALPQKASHT